MQQGPRGSGRNRLVFVATVALLAVQSLFIRRYGEPYPAILMPGFQGSGGHQDGQVKIVRFEAVFVSMGNEFAFPPKVLLSEFPVSHHWAISEYSLKPGSPTPHVAPTGWFGQLGKAHFPGYAARGPSRHSPENIASLKQWLRSRGRSLVPGRVISCVEIRWFRETVQFNGSTVETSREPLDVLVVPLDEGPA